MQSVHGIERETAGGIRLWQEVSQPEQAATISSGRAKSSKKRSSTLAASGTRAEHPSARGLTGFHDTSGLCRKNGVVPWAFLDLKMAINILA
jgi:hypothetical protein